MTILPENFVNKIADPAERKRHGGTAEEAQQRPDSR